MLGDEVAKARLHGAETLRGRLIAEIALYIGTDRHDRMVMEIFPHLRRIDDHRWRNCSDGPMPECMRIFGLWRVPADSTTSSAVILSRPLSVSSTPTARLFSTRMRTTVLPVRRVTRPEARCGRR